MEKKIIIISIISVLLIIFVISSWAPFSTPFGKIISRVNNKYNKIALTFDDGPGTNTIEILNILDEQNIKASFFVVGNQVEKYPEIISEIQSRNHTIGIHTMTHPFLYHKNYEILESKNLVEELTNTSIVFFRPPYGFRTPTTMKITKDLNLTTVLWNVFPRDYSSTSEQIVKRVLRKTKQGSIICLHDGPENRKETVDALPVIIKELEEQGYSFVTLSELIQ